MGRIHLKDIKVHTNHGCLTEEEKIGSLYTVNLIVDCDLARSAQSDELDDTVDYVHLNEIVREEMAIRSKLLEHVAARILKRIGSELQAVDRAWVSVAKMNPPVAGNIASIAIEMERDFS